MNDTTILSENIDAASNENNLKTIELLKRELAAKDEEIKAVKDREIAANEKIILTDLITMMNRFADLNQSTSTVGNKYDSDKLKGSGEQTLISQKANEILNIESIEQLIDDCGKPMPDKWIELDAAVHETKGIHPFVEQLLNFTLKETSPYSVVCGEKMCDGSNKPINSHFIPDFSIVLKSIVAKNRQFYDLSDLLIPIECKKVSENISSGLDQAFGYVMKQLLYKMEMSRNYKSHYHAYCFATDGDKLAIGKVIIQNAKVTILGTIHKDEYLSLSNITSVPVRRIKSITSCLIYVT